LPYVGAGVLGSAIDMERTSPSGCCARPVSRSPITAWWEASGLGGAIDLVTRLIDLARARHVARRALSTTGR
jgi:hypothetical protein